MRKAYVNKIIAMTLLSMNVSIPAFAEWNKDNDKWSWIEEQKVTIGWKEINEKWYHFDDSGYMNIGWIQDGNNWYRLNYDGSMVIGWKNIDGEWYYFDKSGIMKSGWINDNGKWYHLDSNGTMDKGWNEIDGEWYMFDENGVMRTGWIEDNGVRYYADSTGKLEKGSISIDGNIYNFAENGAMLSGSSYDKYEDADVDTSYEDTDTSYEDNESYNKTGYVNTNSDTLNVRSDSSLNSSIVDKLSRGTEVNIIGEDKNGFYPILLNGEKVWVSSDWISFEKPANNNDNTLNSTNDTLYEENSSDDKTITEKDSSSDKIVTLGGIRTTAPSLNDIHYYSDSNIFYKVRLSPPFINSSGNPIKGNCTWYAWGRAWELTGEQPIQANFIGNAYEWWDANKKSGKYQYGSEPRVGAIAVWNSGLPGSGGDGHVAIVEKIDGDKIYISESMWHGDCFAYKEIYSTEYLYGYIYLDRPNY